MRGFDEFKAGEDEHGQAFTAALLWEPYAKVRATLERITADGDERVAVEVRYRF